MKKQNAPLRYTAWLYSAYVAITGEDNTFRLSDHIRRHGVSASAGKAVQELGIINRVAGTRIYEWVSADEPSEHMAREVLAYASEYSRQVRPDLGVVMDIEKPETVQPSLIRPSGNDQYEFMVDKLDRIERMISTVLTELGIEEVV